MSEEPAQLPATPREEADALVPLGYIFAVIVPVVGLILGIIAAVRPGGRARRNGPWIIALATVAFAVWGGVIYAAVEHHSSPTPQVQAGPTQEEKYDEYCKEHEYKCSYEQDNPEIPAK